MPTLDQIDQFYADIFNQFDSGEIDEQQMEDLLEQADDTTENKIHNYGRRIINLESEAREIKAHIDERSKVMRSKKSSADWLRQRAMLHMQRNGFKKVEFADVNVTRRRNKMSVIVDDLDRLPDQFKKTTETTTADKKALYDALQGDNQVLGAHLQENESLIIK